MMYHILRIMFSSCICPLQVLENHLKSTLFLLKKVYLLLKDLSLYASLKLSFCGRAVEVDIFSDKSSGCNFNVYWCPRCGTFCVLIVSGFTLQSFKYGEYCMKFKLSDIAIRELLNPFDREMVTRKSPQQLTAPTYEMIC